MGKGSRELREKLRRERIKYPIEDIHENLTKVLLRDKMFVDEILHKETPPGVDPFLWALHFSDLPRGKEPTCKDCLDFKILVCRGGLDPETCFKYQKGGVVLEISLAGSGHFPGHSKRLERIIR